MIHRDGPTHARVPDQFRDLIVTMDDATSRVCSGFFWSKRARARAFRASWKLWMPRGCSPVLTVMEALTTGIARRKAGRSKTRQTRFGRAMAQLGIDMIPAYSPQARGRSERLFGTLRGALAAGAGLVARLAARPTGPTKSGRFMCYKNRTDLLATNS